MKKYIITQQDINLIVRDLREAPAKYSFTALQIVSGLRPYEEKEKKEKDSE